MEEVFLMSVVPILLHGEALFQSRTPGQCQQIHGIKISLTRRCGRKGCNKKQWDAPRIHSTSVLSLASN